MTRNRVLELALCTILVAGCSQEAPQRQPSRASPPTTVAAPPKVHRSFYDDIPVTVAYDWGEAYSSYPVAATAKHTETGVKIMEAKLKDMKFDTTEGGQLTSTSAVIDAQFFKDGEKLFTAELTVQVRPLRHSRLLTAVIDGKWRSEYVYPDAKDDPYQLASDPGIITRDLESNRIVSRAFIQVDTKRSKGDEQGRIAVVSQEVRKPSFGAFGGSAFGGPLAERRWPAAKETACWMGLEEYYDENGAVIHATKTWRNAGTGLLIEEKPLKGYLQRDHHHYDFMFLDWPMSL